MPVVFVISEEWMLRAGVRAELREKGIKALGMESAEDVGRAIANGEAPQVLVIDGHAKAASDPTVQQLAGRVPAIVIAPRTTTIALGSAAKVLFRPVQIREIVAAVLNLAKGRNA
jgi:DNA-binding response OmpR family regulator